ncbi:MAG TPA: hypothetical protein VIK83_05130 [Coriobacteriia bacterium]
MKLCPKCATENDDRSWMCASCGTTLSEVAPSQAAEPDRTPGWMGLLAIAAGVAVVLVLAIAAGLKPPSTTSVPPAPVETGSSTQAALPVVYAFSTDT